jgi:hypothetical protein
LILLKGVGQWEAGGVGAELTAGLLVSENRWFDPFQIFDICQSVFYQRQKQPLPNKRIV